jgi:heavy metal sensor kinase
VETVRGTDGREYRVATAVRRERWLAPPDFYAQVALPLDVTREPVRRVLTRLAGAGLVLLAFSSLATVILVGRWLRSVSVLQEAAREIGAQNLAHRRLFAPSEDPELAALVHTFNTLLDRLDAVHATQQRLLADASHELRTPLTILLGEMDVVLRRERDAADYRAVIESNREEIARLSRMADNLLALTRADAGEALGASEPIDVHTLCGEVCDRLGPRAEKAGVRLALGPRPEPPLRVTGDATALDRAVFNVIENALAHAPRGESVEVDTAREDGQARIAVRDTGCGIAAEHLPHVFERFYRVDKARERETGGAGLGLAIVQSLVEAHGGRVAAESELGRGSTFTVWLPALPS